MVCFNYALLRYDSEGILMGGGGGGGLGLNSTHSRYSKKTEFDIGSDSTGAETSKQQGHNQWCNVAVVAGD